jgi:hypothetical protein
LLDTGVGMVPQGCKRTLIGFLGMFADSTHVIDSGDDELGQVFVGTVTKRERVLDHFDFQAVHRTNDGVSVPWRVFMVRPLCCQQR